MNRKFFYAQKKRITKLKWSIFASRRKLIRFTRNLKRRRKSPISETNRLQYPYSSYNRYGKNLRLARRKLPIKSVDPQSRKPDQKTFDYLNPTLSLLKVNCMSHIHTVLLFLLNPLLLSLIVLGLGFQNKLGTAPGGRMSSIAFLTNSLFTKTDQRSKYANPRGIFADNNLVPHRSINFVVNKEAYNLLAVHKLTKDVVPYYYHTLVRFMEHCSGKKSAFKFYPFVHQNVRRDFFVRYRI